MTGWWSPKKGRWMQLRTTSTHRTYRYVRVSLVAVVTFLGLGVGIEMALGGPLGSLSAAYYTPARNVFVGGLCAVSLALLALSGRSLEQALLDLAAVLAPVIAFVPTPIRMGTIPGLDPGCPANTSCVPPAAVAGVTNGMLTLSVLGVLGVAAALVLGVVQRTLTTALAGTIVAAGVLIGAAGGWWALSPSTFLDDAHYAATLGFFAIVAVVSAIAAFRPAGSGRRRPVLRVLYAGIAIVIAADLLLLAGVVLFDGDAPVVGAAPLVLIGEAVALFLFAVFWVVQTVELWNDDDPRLHVAA
jgi:hypothetical protein